MRDIYRRFFKITDGPVIDHINEAAKVNDDAHEQYKIILDEVGAKHTYYHRGRKMTAMMFESEPDRNLFKKSGQGWWPKKNSKTGKDLNERLDAIVTKDPNEALKLIGLDNNPCVFSGSKCYWPTLIVIPEAKPVVYVTLPWFDADPKEVEQYRQDRDTGICVSRNLDHILWAPSKDMEEIKNWQMDRHLDEWNESVKAKN